METAWLMVWVTDRLLVIPPVPMVSVLPALEPRVKLLLPGELKVRDLMLKSASRLGVVGAALLTNQMSEMVRPL